MDEQIEKLYELKDRLELAIADHPGDMNIERCDEIVKEILEEVD